MDKKKCADPDHELFYPLLLNDEQSYYHYIATKNSPNIHSLYKISADVSNYSVFFLWSYQLFLESLGSGEPSTNPSKWRFLMPTKVLSLQPVWGEAKTQFWCHDEMVAPFLIAIPATQPILDLLGSIWKGKYNILIYRVDVM